ncbi:MAG: DEAD/DEAH box helicase [Lentisphaerae bacterium]|nr:DEAD/DEAH box helicase [Lentisphaerota bacterium]
MTVPITRKMLLDWGGERVLHDAESLVRRGLVEEAVFDAPYVRGTVMWSNRPLRTAFKLLGDGTVESQCPCWANTERGIICAHVIALGLSLVLRATDPARDEKHREELRRAHRLATIDEGQYITRGHEDTPGAVPALLEVTLAEGWEAAAADGGVPVVAEARFDGRSALLEDVPRGLPLRFSRQDEALLFVLEDISEGPARGRLTVNMGDFVNLIRLKAGGHLRRAGGGAVAVNKTPVRSFLKVELDESGGALVLALHTELPFFPHGAAPRYLVARRSGWAYGADNLWPLENLLPEPYHAIYREPIVVERPMVLAFLRDELPALAAHARIESNVTPDLFTIEPAQPSFRLEVHGSPASLSAVLYAEYDGHVMVAGRADPRDHFGVPDPADILRYTVRNPETEKRALERLAAAGFDGPTGNELQSIVGNRNVLNFLGGSLPALRRLGWKVTLAGRVAPYMEEMPFASPVVRVAVTGGGWFDVALNFDDSGRRSLSQAEVRRALCKGEAFICKDGRTFLLDADAVRAMDDVFADCASAEADAPGHFRVSNLYAPFVRASLQALDGVDVEETPDWRELALRQNREVEPAAAALPPALDAILRPYQKAGVNWLRFLEGLGFSGLLADEMGLGKTVQTLVWLSLPRLATEAVGRPALIVCPTSIVENWAEECARFVPGMKVIAVTGQDREEKWAAVPRHDVAITSYALLRRDIERAVNVEFAVAVLDEAQHIKNRSTQNALSAKRLRARQRLVLTGTPVENSVSDLWSIMDFLMPGYLGGHEAFRTNYEAPIVRSGDGGDLAQTKLRRKMHPFLLRRLKTDVARDLPPKIERTASCTLTEDQQVVYRELLEASRRRLRDMVSAQGFNRSRMEILTTLMRLRQACCHLELLKLPDLNPRFPSAKTDLFFELLDEAMDSGHRVLVFSQFVAMLSILRREMDRREISYCYLDGSTKDRLQIVHRFNTDRAIPAFLISLKAGGTGLNLTGADMVVHFDPWWNPAVENQATDRAYRIGQKRTVYSVRLIARGTVEEKVVALQERKQAVIDATIESDEQIMRKLSWEDIKDILEI